MTAPLPEEKYLKENQVLRREVQTLKELNQDQRRRIQFLEEEINRLKNKTKKPKLQPSRIGLMEFI